MARNGLVLSQIKRLRNGNHYSVAGKLKAGSYSKRESHGSSMNRMAGALPDARDGIHLITNPSMLSDSLLLAF